MANILDYIDWRGDLLLPGKPSGALEEDSATAPFNEVDNLVLAELCFLDFQEFVPSPRLPEEEKAVCPTLAEAARLFFEKNPRDKINLGLLIPREIPELLEKAAASPRFGSIVLSDYINLTDIEREIQFAALTYTLPDNTKYVAFRGTDDTIIAWKEDFNMSILETVPAQTEALAYLRNRLAESAPDTLFRVGGHSKGGNLAVYAALYLSEEERERLLAVYNNDGPGFRVSVRNSPAYKSLSGRLCNLTPYLSIVGALLEHGEDCEVLESDGKGVFQHDGFTWHVMGPSFVRLPDRSPRSHELEATLKAWLGKLNEEEKKTFINTLFELLTSSGAVTLNELNEDKLRASYKIASTLFGLDKNTRDLLSRTLVLLFREQNAVTRARRQREKEEKEQKNKEDPVFPSEPSAKESVAPAASSSDNPKSESKKSSEKFSSKRRSAKHRTRRLCPTPALRKRVRQIARSRKGLRR